MTERNQALCQWYLTNHPAPSWGHIAQGLYAAGNHEILQLLRDQVDYLNSAGEPIISARISVAPISAVTKSASVPILAAVNAALSEEYLLMKKHRRAIHNRL